MKQSVTTETTIMNSEHSDWHSAQPCVELSLFTTAPLAEAYQGFLNFIDAFAEHFWDDLVRHQTGRHSSSVPKIRNKPEFLKKVRDFFLKRDNQTAPFSEFKTMAYAGTDVWDANLPGLEIDFWHSTRTADAKRISNASMFLPLEWFTKHSQEFVNYAVRAAQDFPLLYGTAGYALYIPHFYELFNDGNGNKAQLQSILNKYPGIAEGNNGGTQTLLEKAFYWGKNAPTMNNSLLYTNWLTFLGERYIQNLGGIPVLQKALGEKIIVHDLSIPNCTQVLIQAGTLPDENGNALYDTVNMVLKKYISDYSFYFSKKPLYEI